MSRKGGRPTHNLEWSRIRDEFEDWCDRTEPYPEWRLQWNRIVAIVEREINSILDEKSSVVHWSVEVGK